MLTNIGVYISDFRRCTAVRLVLAGGLAKLCRILEGDALAKGRGADREPHCGEGLDRLIRSAASPSEDHMAVYHLRVKVLGRSKGQSAVGGAAYRTGTSLAAAIAYRTGSKLDCEQTGRSWDYTRRIAIEGAEIITPEGALAWTRDRQALWSAVEAAEKLTCSPTCFRSELESS